MEEEIATHSSILAWEMPWTEERGGLQSMGSQRSRPSCLQALVHPSHSVGLHGPYPQLPPTASLCSEAIDSSHSISIDLSLSPSFFLLPSSIDPPAPLLPSLRLLHTDKFLLPALMHRTCSK